jgi:hypothetical protein
MSTTKKLIDSICDGSDSIANESFLKAIGNKVAEALEIKRVAITTDFYNKQKEIALSK